MDLTALTICLALGFVVAVASKRIGLGSGLATAAAGVLAAWFSGFASGGFGSDPGTTSPRPSLIFQALVVALPIVAAPLLYLAGLTLGTRIRRTPPTTVIADAAVGILSVAARVFVVAALIATILPIDKQVGLRAHSAALLIAALWSLGEPFLALDGRRNERAEQRSLWSLTAALPIVTLFHHWAIADELPFLTAVAEPALGDVGIALMAGSTSAAAGSLLVKALRSELSPLPIHLAVMFGAVAAANGFSGDLLVAPLTAGIVYGGLSRIASRDLLSPAWEAGTADGAWSPLRLGASIVIVATAGWLTPTALAVETIGQVLGLLALTVVVQILLTAVSIGIPPRRAPRRALVPLAHGWAFFPGSIAIAAAVLITTESGDAALGESLSGPLVQFLFLSLLLQGASAPIVERLLGSGEIPRDAQLSRVEQLDAKWLAVRAAARTVEDLQADGLVPPATASALKETLTAELGKIEVEKSDLDSSSSQLLGQRRWTHAIRTLLDAGRAAVERARREGRISDSTADATLRELSRRWEHAEEQSVRGLFDDEAFR